VRRVTTSWRLIEEVLKEHVHSAYTSLRPPVSDRHLALLKGIVSAPVPRTFEQSLRLHDGMRGSYLGRNRLINNWALLPVADILSVWKMENDLQRECEFGGCPLTTTGALKNDVRWRPGWLPAMDREGDKIVIDLDPGPEGKLGQVFCWYNYGGRPMRVVAGSWAAWLDSLAEGLSTRRFTLDESGAVWFRDGRFP
jgi:cell wall assembly regulator SMI1